MGPTVPLRSGLIYYGSMETVVAKFTPFLYGQPFAAMRKTFHGKEANTPLAKETFS